MNQQINNQQKIMKPKTNLLRHAVCCAALLAGAVNAPAAWNTIYSETFSGLNTTSMIGKAPDIAPGAETWALNNGTMLDAWKADGSALATGGGVLGQSSLLLPFAPVAGNTYQLSGRISLTTATGQWVALGFADRLTTTDGTSGLFAFSALNGVSWALHGDLGANSLQAFAGPDTANLMANTFSVNPTDLRIVLDTTGAQWTTTVFATSANLNGGAELQIGTFAYASNPTILGVGFSKGHDVGGLVDNFRLEVAVVPEPTVLSLGVLGGLTLLLASRRRA